MSFRYSKAIVCGVPSSLPVAALRQDNEVEPVNLELARKQHKDYVNVLEQDMGLEVIALTEDERFPDCVFVEDVVVVADNTALLTIPGHPARQGETQLISEVIASLGLKIIEMKEPGLMDGGDVLFTGKEFFVGLSCRTNKEGIAQLANAFPQYCTTSIPVKAGLHLKSFCSMVGDDVIAIGKSDAAKEALEMMKSNGKFNYQFIMTNDDKAANCVLANDVLIHVSDESFPNSSIKYSNLNYTKVPLSMTELNKVDGCFTCCSILIP